MLSNKNGMFSRTRLLANAESEEEDWIQNDSLWA